MPSRIVEMPDTRLKQVTFRLWNRKGGLVSTEVWLISEKDITGETTDDMESPLLLDVTNPLPGIFLFERMNLLQINALNLPINNSYAASNISVRADAGQPLVVTGKPDLWRTFSSAARLLDSGVYPFCLGQRVRGRFGGLFHPRQQHLFEHCRRHQHSGRNRPKPRQRGSFALLEGERHL
ncbi:MAG: hypothetical protein IPI26_02270 [Elusimicrobia bacterium]|nr:hypothetical protein [Elusimicrobiota bacterium]